MTPTEQDLAQQLAAHERWEWAPGMAATDPSDPHGMYLITRADGEGVLRRGSGSLPVLDFPPLHGFMISRLVGYFVRVDHRGEAEPGGERWRVTCRCVRTMTYRGATLGEALARALLALWGEGR